MTNVRLDPELITLNHLSLDDCSLLGRLMFSVGFGVELEAYKIVGKLDERFPALEQRRLQVKHMASMCRDLMRRGVDLRPATHPHETAAAWLIWIKSTDSEYYDEIQNRWPMIVGELNTCLDCHEMQDLLRFTAMASKAWYSLVTSYDRDLLSLHRNITARVYPEARLWSPCSKDLDDLSCRFAIGFRLVTKT